MDKKHISDVSRRQFVKKALYVTPVILTLPVVPSLASAGSGYTRPEYPTQPSSLDRHSRHYR
ncbi:MAG: hypothetical protein OEY67_07640 [Gammaproteobacteria bacterium]|nr:hypothetical protein [Gammaproteobacteria bacterium]